MIRRMITLSWAAAAVGVLGITAIASAADNPVVASGCGADACCNKICKSVVEQKKVTKRVYDDSCEDFCLPKCSLFGCFFGHSSCSDDCGKCGHVKTSKFLLIRNREHEECVRKCIVVNEPCCVPTCSPAPVVQPASAAPAPRTPTGAPQTTRQIIYVPGQPLLR
jgi:hypothetical protein